MYVQVSQKWRTNYLLPYRGCKYIKKMWKKIFRQKNQLFLLLLLTIIRCDQLKNKLSRRVTYGNPCYSIGSKANSIYFLNDRSVQCKQRYIHTSLPCNVTVEDLE
jgi:hypothetical protein